MQCKQNNDDVSLQWITHYTTFANTPQTLLWSSKLSDDQSNVVDSGKLLRGDNGGTENADLLKSVLSSRLVRS